MITETEVERAVTDAERALLNLAALRDQQVQEKAELLLRIAELENVTGRNLDARMANAVSRQAAVALLADVDAEIARLDTEIAAHRQVITDADDLRSLAEDRARVVGLDRQAREALATARSAIAAAVSAVRAMDEAHSAAVAAQQALDARAEELRARGLLVPGGAVVDEGLIHAAMNSDVAVRETFKAMRGLGQRQGTNMAGW